jgi:hypothetical protein
MSWKTVLVVVCALAIGFFVLFRIATREPEPAVAPPSDAARVTPG